MSFPEIINLYFLMCFEWHSSLSESSGKILTALNGSKDFLFYVDHFSSAFQHCFATTPAHSAPYPAFQVQRVVFSGPIYVQGDLVHSGRGSIVYVH